MLTISPKIHLSGNPVNRELTIFVPQQLREQRIGMRAILGRERFRLTVKFQLEDDVNHGFHFDWQSVHIDGLIELATKG